MRMRVSSSLLLVGLLLGLLPAAAQQTTGMITGVVQDGQGAVVPGASVTVINQAQGATFRQLETSAEGTFVVTPVPPGIYTVTVEKGGFKKYTKTDVRLSALERVGLPPIVLELGAVGESITVEASSVTLQTVSAERSGTITTSQIVDLASSGRSYTDLLKTVAGFNPDTNNANGLRTDQNAMQVDGTTNQDVGNNSYTPLRLNSDIIAEFRVVTNGQQAEFGRAAGANIVMVTKGGTKDFHGGAYIFLRNEWMNANSWTNNFNGLARARNRNRTQGFQVGGPAYIPGKFNTSKDKLFFFTNFEFQRPRLFDALQSRTMPTKEERLGDFTKTQENGRPVTIKDPTTGQPFSGNIIPTSRINKFGQELLNFFPEPNRIGVDNAYNYQYQFAGSDKRDDMNFRGDWNISTNWKAAGRLNLNKRDALQSAGLNVNNQIGLSPFHAQTGGIGSSGTVTTIISPTLTNEVNYGNTRNWLPNVIEDDSKYLRKNSGVNVPALYPNADPLGQIPNMTFGGVTNPPTMYIGGMPYDNENITNNVVDNVAKVTANHTLKFGFSYETSFKRQTATIVNNGRIDFSRDTANPGDTGWAFSNALLGNYLTYEQSSTYRKGYYRYHTVEWYGQDNWRVRPNLTVDFGVRFSILGPWYDEKKQVSSLRLANYTAAQRVQLYQPTLVGGVRSSLNPLTGQTGPAALIGAIAPGSGDPFNGMVVGGENGVERGMVQRQGVLLGPRFGLAWTPAGPGTKTVVRLGGGVFYERIQGNMIFNQINYPPGIVTPKLYYGNLSNLGSASQNLFPLNVAGLSPEGKIPTVYNYNLSVQRELPLHFLLDVGYVGTQTRHGLARYPFNEAPFGSAWLPQNQDPAKAAGNLTGDNAMPVDFLRPYTGYAGGGTAVAQSGLGGGGFIATFGSSSSYNGLQISLNRRMSDLTVGVNYTWSKTLGTDTDFQFAGNFVDHRKADYGLLTYDRTQSLVVNYIYNVPRIARDGSALAHPVFKAVLNGWEVSGITSLTSGAPQVVAQTTAQSDVGRYAVQGVGATTLNRRITGSEGWSPRPLITCNPNLSGGSRTLGAFIDTSCFAPAGKGSLGMESAVRPFRGPGVNNWDLSLYKKIPVGGSEDRYFQLRFETYNAWNHTQWNAFANNPTFANDGTGRITNLSSLVGGGGGRFGFGALSGVRTPRNIQIALKFYF
ncbi:MAG: TonB-dependent receptor [Bryobacterales bacterium]|nr:TonB-dependent receptor [Bryobacterales bacterium]